MRCGLFSSEITLVETHFNKEIDGDVFVKIRQNSEPVKIQTVANRINDSCVLILDKPTRGVTPGQSGVLYNEENLVVAYGVIK